MSKVITNEAHASQVQEPQSVDYTENVENPQNQSNEILNDFIDETGIISDKTKIFGNIETKGHLAIAGIVEGDISAKGNVIITGTVKGKIKCDNLILRNCSLTTNIEATGNVAIEENVTVSGKISCKTIAIKGSVTGDISASEKIALAAGAVINGNLTTSSIGVEFGAKVNGNIKMT